MKGTFAGTFQGQWMRGMRHGYGVRTSATFGLASHYRPKSVRGSLSSIPASEQADPASDRDRKIDDFRGGFVLKSRSDEPPARRRSLVEKSTNLKKSILQVTLILIPQLGKFHESGDTTALYQCFSNIQHLRPNLQL
ncbi:uncharacterized protein TNCV_214421 [Trichonephila clavipes]|nr:uncharacterized protein TNCV_214421 [Trichonephila clavipes]